MCFHLFLKRDARAHSGVQSVPRKCSIPRWESDPVRGRGEDLAAVGKTLGVCKARFLVGPAQKHLALTLGSIDLSSADPTLS